MPGGQRKSTGSRGLRVLEEAWDDFLLEGFSVKFVRFLWFWVVSSWFQKVWSCVPGGAWRSGEVQEFQNGRLRVLEEVWDDFLLKAFAC